MIYVCDAIMGSGKSSAIIQYMNEHPDDRFLYISPYLEEAARIRDGCPALDFAEPRGDLEEYRNRKRTHAEMLLRQGRNVASTHQAYVGLSREALKIVREMEYTLVIDESVDLLRRMSVNPQDLSIAEGAGLVRRVNGEILLTEKAKDYKPGGGLYDFLSQVRRHATYTYAGAADMFWLLSPDLLNSFRDVYIMTYLFEGQDMCFYMKANHIVYEKIGVRRRGERYEFCDAPGEMPEYTKRLKSMIHICNNEKLNAIGKSRTALSATKYKKGKVDLGQLRNNLNNWFRNIMKDYGSRERMWTTFKDYKQKLSGKGFAKCEIECNARATNKYGDRKVLAYLVNIYMNMPNKRFYQSRGVEIDEDLYSLSVLVQWIWRSAIRNGEEIYVYIPSRRMRELLIKWIDSFDAEERGDHRK